MTTELEYSHSDVSQAISDFISLAILIFKILGNNPELCKKSHLKYKEDQIIASPFFKNILELIDSFNVNTIKILGLKCKSKTDDKTTLIKRLFISTKINNFFIFTKGIPELYTSISEKLSIYYLNSYHWKKFQSLDEFKLDYLTMFNKVYIEFFKENNSYFLFAQQLVLYFQNNIDYIISGCDPVIILYYYSNKNLFFDNPSYSLDKAINLLDHLSNYNDIIYNNVYRKKYYDKITKFIEFQDFPRKNEKTIESTAYLTNLYIRSSKLSSNISLSNHIFYKLPEIGMKCFLLELPKGSYTLPLEHPSYFIEISSLSKFQVFLGLYSNHYNKNVKRPFRRINKYFVSRSLASYYFHGSELFTINIKKVVGKFPAMERSFDFTYNKSRNTLTLEKLFLTRQMNMDDMNDLVTFDGNISYFNDKYLKYNHEIRDWVDGNIYLNQKPYRILITNFNNRSDFIHHDRIVVIYIRFLSFIISKYISRIIDYCEYWSDRAEIWEGSEFLYMILRIPYYEELFINNLNLLLNDCNALYIFDYKIELYNMIKRYRKQYPMKLPDLKYFDQNKGRFDIKNPTYSQILSDYSIVFDK